MDRRVFFALLGFGAVVLVVALLFLLLRPFLAAMAWAGVLALAAQPVHRAFLRWTGGRPNLAALGATAVTLLVVAVPLGTLAVLFAAEAVHVFDVVQKAIAAGTVPGWDAFLQLPWVAQFLGKIEPLTRGMDLRATSAEALRAASTFAAGFSKSLLAGVVVGVIRFLVMTVVLFFCFRDGARVVRQAWAVVPIKDLDKKILEATVTRVVGAVLYGIVLTCVVQGILGGIGFAMVGLPSAIFFGAIMIVAAFIPAVGVALIWAPAVAYLALIGDYGRAGALLAWSALVVSAVDNLIRPLFISGHGHIPLLAVALGVLGGLLSLGFLGIVLGPLFLCIFLELVRIYREGMLPEEGDGRGAGP